VSSSHEIQLVLGRLFDQLDTARTLRQTDRVAWITREIASAKAAYGVARLAEVEAIAKPAGRMKFSKASEVLGPQGKLFRGTKR
jgi:hypothetical protein